MVTKGDLLLLFSVVLVLTGIFFVCGGSFSALPTTMTLNQTVTNFYNITLNNTIAAANITRVNVTLPPQILYDVSTSGTNALATFTNTSTVLDWFNSTWLVGNSTPYFFKSFWFNASAAAPGTYNLTVRTLDSIGVMNMTNISVTISDTVAPSVIAVYPANISYSLSSINLNLTATDNVAIRSCWYTLNNGVTNRTLSNTTASAFNATNSSIAEGSYTANFYCNDTAQNVGTSSVSFSLDTTRPTITLIGPENLTSSSSTSWDFTFNVTDNSLTNCSLILDGSFINFNSSVNVSGGTMKFTNSLSSVGNHDWSVNCTDVAGNNNQSVTSRFVISETQDPVSNGGRSGGLIYSPSQTVLSAGYTVSLSADGKIKFKINNQIHELNLDGIKGSAAIITVSSTPQQKSLSVGEEWKVDVDDNGYYDLSVMLISVSAIQAKVTAKLISEMIGSGSTTGATTSTNFNQSTSVSEDKSDVGSSAKSNTTIWVIVVIVLIVSAIGGGYAWNRNKKEY